MSLSPLLTKKVIVTTTAEFAGQAELSSSPASKAVIFNAGPGLVFAAVTTAAGTPAVVDEAFPIPAGQTQALTVPTSQGYGVSLVSSADSVAYVSYVRGDVEAVSALAELA